MAVRAPMQWTGHTNGGFSIADPKELVRPPLVDPPYGYEAVNVSSQRANPDSLLNWLASLIRTRKECGEIGRGKWTLLDTGNDAVFGIQYEAAGASIVVVTNLSAEEQDVTVEIPDPFTSIVTDLFGDREYDAVSEAKQQVRLDGYGYRWIRVNGVY